MSQYWNPVAETRSRPEIERLQTRRLARLVDLAKRAPFHETRLQAAGLTADDFRSVEDVRRLPFMTRADWMTAQGAAGSTSDLLTADVTLAVRQHATSGTTGRTPLRAADTATDWSWITEMWCYALWAAGVRPSDRVYTGFGYGQFIGFWGLHYAAERLGALVFPGGAMTTSGRVEAIWDNGATVVCATPTLALRLAEEARSMGRPFTDGPVERLILSGEPAGSIPATKALIEDMWGARASDTAGMTEIGTIMAYECDHFPGGPHIIENHFIEEVIDPETGHAVPYGELGERVVTSFGRSLLPLLRYRTSDLVVRVPASVCSCGRTFDVYEGGILGRIDDMLLVRGTNVYPRAVESVVREHRSVAEFQIRLFTENAIRDEIEVLVELPEVEADAAGALEQEIAADLKRGLGGLRFGVRSVPAGTLPRFELKARRVVDERVVKGL